MAKRGSSGISRIIAVNKPCGMSSHDVVNRCRSLYGERRVGHMGTLDPLASGVLLICIGPATRLDAYVVGHGKRYRMAVHFGLSTATDDREGAILKTAEVPGQVGDLAFAQRYVASMVGKHTQIPPVYSAIKVDGKKAYEEVRRGNIINLEPREFEVYDACCTEVRQGMGVDGASNVEWIVEMSVSSGTYMRSIARDMGRDLKTCAYMASLERVSSGTVLLDECATLEELEQDPECATLDPLRVLGIRFAFVRADAQKVANGAPLPERAVHLNEPILNDLLAPCTCTTSVIPSVKPPSNGEIIGAIVDNRLKALYEYCEPKHRYETRCVFSVGVERGKTV